MSVSENDLALIRRDWAVVAAVPTETARVFYAHLFRLDPSTKPLFQSDMAVQGRKLVETLGFIVDSLEDLDAIVPIARDLAIRHVAYGVTADQYQPVGAALIHTLKDLVGPNFDKEAEASWGGVYSTLASEMVTAAHPETHL
jgi:hemoglobin-like flavoprotein